MNLSDFDYNLPEKLIAQHPVVKRDSSRLMVFEKERCSLNHTTFFNISDFLKDGDVLVINDTRVFPARLRGVKENTGGRVEVLLLKSCKNGTEKNNIWEVLLNTYKGIKKGSALCFGNGELKGMIRDLDGNGKGILEFEATDDIFNILDRIGEPPLPPYIKRKSLDVSNLQSAISIQESGIKTGNLKPETQNFPNTIHYSIFTDKERYQTVYAREIGAVAAPTAGLHFSNELLERIKKIGVEIINITLHVGLGTFKPVRVSNIKDHIMDSERYAIALDNAEKLNKAKMDKRRIIAVGTTTARTLESEIEKYGKFSTGEKETSLFIYPGFKFKAVDALITNFHLPKSTLLMLVSAFCGLENIMDCYRKAIEMEYRFYSYGDAMFIM